MPATANLPTLDSVTSSGGNAVEGITGVLDTIRSLGGGGGGSPTASVDAALGGLRVHLDIDLSGISDQLPSAITTITHALPDDSLKFVEDIQSAYQQVTAFLHDSEVVKAIQSGSDLEHTALALVDDILHLFQTRLGTLAAELVGADELQRVTDALALIDSLRNDYQAHRGDLAGFLTSQLVGVEHDLLAAANQEAAEVVNLLAPLAEDALSTAIGPSRDSLAQAAIDVAQAFQDFDPANLSLYAALEARLDVLDPAITAAFDALEQLYAAVGPVVDSPAWDAVLTAYAQVLEAIPLQSVPTVDDVVDQIAAVMDDLLARLTMAFSPQELADRITRISTRVTDSFAASPLGQARQIILDFLESVRHAIEQVPTEQVQQAITDMLRRVKQELDSLGITSIRATIEQKFREAGEFIDQHLGDDLLQQVHDALDGVLQELNQIPIAQVGQELADAIGQAGQVVQDLETQLQQGLEEIKGLLANLDDLSFRPVSDEVLEEIDALKAKLQAIKPNALSDVEKLAIQGALALLRAIDLEGLIETELKHGFALVADELKQGVDAVLAAWMDFRNRIGSFDPDTVLKPLNEVLDDVTGATGRLNGATLLKPLYDVVDALTAQLNALSPGRILDPLQQPYGAMMAVVQRADPSVWVQPLRDLYAEIDRLLEFIDIRPLMDTLEEKERDLFAQARQTIMDGLDAVHLPPPLDDFYATVKVVAGALTDALFGDPDTGIRAVNTTIRDNVRLSSLLSPLDAAFDGLLEMVDSVPHDDLVTAMEAIRAGLGAVLPAIDPSRLIARLREGQARLAELSPVAAAALIPALPAMRASLAARLELAPPENQAAASSLLARVDVSLQPIRVDLEDSRLVHLQQTHEALVARVAARIARLDAARAQAAYDALRANLSRLLPAFLQQPAPLTYDDIRAGLNTLRPSLKAQRLDDSVDRFLAQLKPVESALEPAVNGFFQMIRDAALVIHPASLKDAVGAIYDTVRTKLHVLDPDELVDELRRDIYEPLLDPLRALDPAAIKAQIDALYQHVVTLLTGRVKGLVDQVKQAVDALLAQVRQALASVTAALRQQLTAILTQLKAILDSVDHLVVDELFGRLKRVIDNLETSFDQELDRVRNGFDAMLNAIPIGGGRAQVTVTRA